MYQSAHLPIVGTDLFEAVQVRLSAQQRRHASGAERETEKAPLTGRIFDPVDNPLSPSFSRGRSGRIYRCYVSALLQQGTTGKSPTPQRVPAAALEHMLSTTF